KPPRRKKYWNRSPPPPPPRLLPLSQPPNRDGKSLATQFYLNKIESLLQDFIRSVSRLSFLRSEFLRASSLEDDGCYQSRSFDFLAPSVHYS
ncbi:hypothetical protein QQP08_004110, partial [Theobroma cacao]